MCSADELPSGTGTLLLGHLEEGTYFITIFGIEAFSGTATLRIGNPTDNFDVLTLADTKLLRYHGLRDRQVSGRRTQSRLGMDREALLRSLPVRLVMGSL